MADLIEVLVELIEQDEKRSGRKILSPKAFWTWIRDPEKAPPEFKKVLQKAIADHWMAVDDHSRQLLFDLYENRFLYETIFIREFDILSVGYSQGNFHANFIYEDFVGLKILSVESILLNSDGDDVRYRTPLDQRIEVTGIASPAA